jgi:hypothetical protein
MKVLVEMGAEARPVLPHLERLIDRRRRLHVDIGDEDAEMRADELLLAAAIATRARISGERYHRHDRRTDR